MQETLDTTPETVTRFVVRDFTLLRYKGYYDDRGRFVTTDYGRKNSFQASEVVTLARARKQALAVIKDRIEYLRQVAEDLKQVRE